MSQTVYTLDPSVGYVGFKYDNSTTLDVGHGPAAEAIPAGRLVERQVDGSIRLYRGTGVVYGISLAKFGRSGNGTRTAAASTSYAQYESVPVMRRGRMYAAFESNAVGVALSTVINVYAASDDTLGNAQYRGRLTSRATSATTGAEIVAGPPITALKFYKAPAATDTIAVVELSYS